MYFAYGTKHQLNKCTFASKNILPPNLLVGVVGEQARVAPDSVRNLVVIIKKQRPQHREQTLEPRGRVPERRGGGRDERRHRLGSRALGEQGEDDGELGGEGGVDGGEEEGGADAEEAAELGGVEVGGGAEEGDDGVGVGGGGEARGELRGDEVGVGFGEREGRGQVGGD